MTPQSQLDSPLPCPFCGGANLKFEAGCYIQCSCSASGPAFDGVPSEDDLGGAVAKWNARDPELLDENTRLKKALRGMLVAADHAGGLGNVDPELEAACNEASAALNPKEQTDATR